ncbi:MAG: hypothetical protein FJY07_10910, partial [Bacteroidetes bacterium]|nr:hypothetical protein [Bacteroidota bacterium]
MKTTMINCKKTALKLILFLMIGFSGCSQVFKPMSEFVEDKHAGMNGGFEHTNSGLPVNWLLYTPKTVPDGDFEMVVDTSEFIEGRQSLKFIVRSCSSNGGWHSPGFCNQFEAKPGITYRVSFWVKNHDSSFMVRVGGISASTGQYETIVKSGEAIDPWKLYEYNYSIPEKMNSIRFEVNILQPP